jgi:hypothetical protein
MFDQEFNPRTSFIDPKISGSSAAADKVPKVS